MAAPNSLTVIDNDSQKRLIQLAMRYARMEYITGGARSMVGALVKDALKVLNERPDDLTAEFGIQVYQKMMTDPAVEGCIDVLKGRIIGEGPRTVPKVKRRGVEGYDQSSQVAEFVKRNLDYLRRRTPVTDVFEEMLDATWLGFSMAVVNLEAYEDAYIGRPLWRIAAIKPKDRSKFGMIVDRWMNVHGILPKNEGIASTAPIRIEDIDFEQVAPRERVWIWSHKKRAGDPRGKSILRTAYNAWYIKTQLLPFYLQFLTKYATGSLVGILGEKQGTEAEYENDAGETESMDALEAMASELRAVEGGSSIAVPHGGDVKSLYPPSGAGKAFIDAAQWLDRQIALAIVKSPRTIFEAEHGAKVDSEAASDMTENYVRLVRSSFEASFLGDVIYPLIVLNFGEEAADRYCPDVTLQSIQQQDFSKAAPAVAQLWDGGPGQRYLHESQVPATDAMLGLEERDMEAWQEDLQQAEADRILAEAQASALADPRRGLNPSPTATPSK